ncbi:MAG: prolipoprotein diacylglyceryl transferase [Gammaproteobacteria bacterium]
MLHYPNINPILLQIGAFKIYWYGFMYLAGLAGAWFLARYRILQNASRYDFLSADLLGDFLLCCMFGVVIGGRVGHILFYDFAAFLNNPLVLFKTWQGGMSFHGGLIGVMLVCFIFARKKKLDFALFCDFLAPLAPIGLGLGRLGNFINGELWGRVTTMPWGMVFPHVDFLPRHPSQLYEVFLEGICLFVILWIYSAKPRPRWAVSGMFLLFYGIFRFLVEFVREPEVASGFFGLDWMTMGQLLSVPMILVGAWLVIKSYR